MQSMSVIAKTLAQNIKHYRNIKQLTQDELAQKAGVNRSHLATIESGHQSNTSIKTLEKLAQVLKVSVSDLLRNHSS